MNAPSLFSKRAFNVCLSCRRDLLRGSRRFTSSPTSYLAFQSYPLNPQPPIQPRNAGVPDSSIARPVQPLPKVHETRPPQSSIPEQVAQQSSQEFAQADEIIEAEQPDTSKIVPKTTTATPSQVATSPAPAARPKSRLRTPRKAAMKLTPAAVAHLRALLDQPEPKLIKVGVRNRGCSGLAYHLEFVDKPGKFDETVEQDGVRVLIDSKALFSIIGSEMDWVEDKLNQRFVFRNPNIKEQCGCGESFMV
ncbi:Iron-sulfur assembly protein 1 [Coniochaeta pulveracea]|uniref:Iron-sulfur assembly protein 1 n=1 Tax=Coniochaeta pulveracea TaxID=177199 RepID=A0A420XZZ2_9PEZI|nr:Iron-sulfur assembly protein 1 [Coniochaeta pulveracea]